jgi:hypothetical protein
MPEHAVGLQSAPRKSRDRVRCRLLPLVKAWLRIWDPRGILSEGERISNTGLSQAATIEAAASCVSSMVFRVFALEDEGGLNSRFYRI